MKLFKYYITYLNMTRNKTKKMMDLKPQWKERKEKYL